MPESNVREVAASLGEVYFIAKDAKSEQEDLRLAFFAAAAQAHETKGLAQKTVEVPQGVDATSYAEQYHPGWKVVDVAHDHTLGQGAKVLMVEDPDTKPWQEVIQTSEPVIEVKKDGTTKEHPGYVVSKTIRSGSALVDDERLKRDNYALYQAVTEFPGFALYADLVAQFTEWQPDELEMWLEDHGVERVMKSLKSLTPEQVDALKPYVYEGPKSSVLNVRYAKPDEQGSD
jgi:hypothetical protein